MMFTEEIKGLTAAPLLFILPVFIIVPYVASCLFSYFRPSLRKLPGPILARFTALWKVYITIKGDAHVSYQKLHKKYGPIARTGPNTVSLADPAEIPAIYLSGNTYLKASFPVSSVAMRRLRGAVKLPCRL